MNKQMKEIKKLVKKACNADQYNRFLRNTEEREDLIIFREEAKYLLPSRSIKPKTKENHVGVELEFIGPRNSYIDIMLAVMKAGLEKNVVLGYDGSIELDYENDYFESGYEIRIIGTEKTIVSHLKKVLNILSWHDTYVNETCGFHVHLDGRNRDRYKMYDKLYNLKDLFYNMVESDRKYNTYCEYPDERRYETGGHYRGIELSDMDTIEVRLHHGTLDFDEVSNWVKLLLRTIKSTEKANSELWVDKDKVPKFVGPRLTKYVKKQIKRYAA